MTARILGSTRSSTRRYGKKASEKVQKALGEMKRGTLRSGSSQKPVRSRKQAIAIGLSEARRGGAKVPRRPAKTRTTVARKSGQRTASARSHAR